MEPLTTARPEDLGMSAERLARIGPLAESWIKPGLHQALVLLVLRRGRVVLESAHGHPRTGSSEAPMPQDSLFPVASLSKLVTATAIMMLVERGLVSLNQPIADFIPEFSGKHKDRVTLWHLLTHSSGGLGLEEMDAYLIQKRIAGFATPPAPPGQDKLIHAYLHSGFDIKLTHKPGTQVAYSNYAYELLGEALRQVTGRSIADFAQENIFAPLGMGDSSFRIGDLDRRRLVDRPPDAPHGTGKPHWYCDGLEVQSQLATPWAHSGLISTARDMAVFGQLFLKGGTYAGQRLLSQATVASMTRNHTQGLPDMDRDPGLCDAARGLGWDIPADKVSLMYADLYSPGTYSHSGTGGVLLWVDPSRELVGVYFSIEVRTRNDLQRNWAGNLFANAVSAAVVD